MPRRRRQGGGFRRNVRRRLNPRRPYTRRRRYRQMRRGGSAFARRVKRVVFGLAEKKYKSINLNAQTAAAPWTHDSLRYANLWNFPASQSSLFPSQGASDGERNGDEIYVHGIRVRGVLDVPYDRPDTEIKMWFVPWNSVQGDPTQKADFMHGTINNVMLDGIQTDRWKGIRYLGKLKVRPTDSYAYKMEGADPLYEMAGRERKLQFNRYITIKRKCTFKTDGDTVVVSGLKEAGTLIFAIYCNVGTGTLDTCVVARNLAATIYYKDP